MENPLYMEVLIGKTLISGTFSIAMFDYTRIYDMMFYYILIDMINKSANTYHTYPICSM